MSGEAISLTRRENKLRGDGKGVGGGVSGEAISLTRREVKRNKKKW